MSVVAKVRAVSTEEHLVRADGDHGQHYLLNKSVMGPLMHTVKPGDCLQIQVSVVPDKPHKILQVRRV
jgi:hypothetical protein